MLPSQVQLSLVWWLAAEIRPNGVSITFSIAGKNLVTETAYRRRSFLGLMVPEDKVHHGSGIRGQA